MVDAIDKKIISILQKNARTSNAQIARELDLAPSGIHERVKKLEARRIIQGYGVNLDWAALGLGVTAFLFVRTSDRPGETSTPRLLANLSQVEEVHHIAGEDCYLVKVRCASNEDLGRLLREDIGRIEAVLNTKTSVVLKTTKETEALDLAKVEPICVVN